MVSLFCRLIISKANLFFESPELRNRAATGQQIEEAALSENQQDVRRVCSMGLLFPGDLLLMDGQRQLDGNGK